MQAYRAEDFPVTIVRPSLTYDPNFPIAIGGWGCYNLADRLLKGKPIIIHGDGSSLWTVTHAEDFGRGFLGLLGNPQALGNAFHITTDDVLTWNQIYLTIAEALRVEAKIVYMPSDFIYRHNPTLGAGLLGDKTWSNIFDNSKIKAFVPHALHQDHRAYVAMLEDPARDASQKPREVVAALALQPGQVVADIGSGSGYFTLRFSQHVGDQGRVYAVDVDPKMVRDLNRRVRDLGRRNVVTVLADPDDPLLGDARSTAS